MEELLSNPYVELAKKNMTPEQLEQYKKMGEYMYGTNVYKNAEFGEKLKEAKIEDFAKYAIEGLKSGLDPMELSKKEIKALVDTYGLKWYEKFGFAESEVPKFEIGLGDLKLSRQQRRFLERKVAKEKNREGRGRQGRREEV